MESHKQHQSEGQQQLTVTEAYAQAVDHFNSGRYAQADRLCTAIIKTVPRHIDAINLLGAVAQKVNRHDLAVRQFKQAINLDTERAFLYFNLGMSLDQLGQREEAIQALKSGLKKEPGNQQIKKLLHTFSTQGIENSDSLDVDKAQQALQHAIFFHQSAQLSQALTWYKKSLEIRPENVIALSNLSVILLAQDNPSEAVEYLQRAISIQPDLPEAHFNLGNALATLGKPEEAVVCYRKAISIRPDYWEPHINLANELHMQGLLDEAITHYNRAIAINPSVPDAHYNLANALVEQNKYDEAITSYQKAITIKPDYPEALCNLGDILRIQGKLDESLSCLNKSLSYRADFPAALCNLGNTLRDQGKPDQAIHYYRKALSIDSSLGVVWKNFSLCLKRVSFSQWDETFASDLIDLLDKPTAVSPREIAKPLLSLLRTNTIFKNIMAVPRSDLGGNNALNIIESLSRIPLLIKLMMTSHIPDLDLENLFILLRKAMLDAVMSAQSTLNYSPFHIALSIHCYTNEYVFFESREEREKINQLVKRIATAQEQNHDIPAVWIVILGAYRPLSDYAWSERLLDGKWPDDVKMVMTQQIENNRTEQTIRDGIPCISPMQNSISKAVRDQYENNPYPRWVHTKLPPRSKTIKTELQSVDIHLDVSEEQLAMDPDILIAGCGTGQQALSTAAKYPDCHITAVDLSLSSLSYAVRKTRELGFNNIEYLQGDILELNCLNRQFDIIECFGVLHHMAEPLTGWKVLVNLLRDNGLMKIGLYSAIGRRSIAKARDYIEKNGFRSTPEDIRSFREEIKQMDITDSSEIRKIMHYSDFYSLSECRDLVFHVQEHCFTLPQIEEALQKLGLTFLGFEFNDIVTLKKFRKAYPEPTDATSLSTWNQFEIANPETFREPYQFWVRKKVR